MPKQETLKTQADKFKEAARKAETDDDEKRFNERLGKIARRPSKEEKAADSQ